jgi:hypothetical protein
VKVKQIKKQKGATGDDKDLQFVERKISEIRKNAL